MGIAPKNTTCWVTTTTNYGDTTRIVRTWVSEAAGPEEFATKRAALYQQNGREFTQPDATTLVADSRRKHPGTGEWMSVQEVRVYSAERPEGPELEWVSATPDVYTLVNPAGEQVGEAHTTLKAARQAFREPGGAHDICRNGKPIPWDAPELKVAW